MSKGENQSKGNLQDLVLDLNFVPQWAREKPKTPTWEERPDRKPREGRGGKHHQGRGRGGPGGGGNRHQQRGGPRGERSPRPHRVRRAPVKVAFIPDRDRLGKVVKLIRQTKRAYALRDIADRFMANPDFFLVKLQLFDGEKAEGLELFQCKADQMVFLDEASCREHAVGASLEGLFHAEETEVEPPSGNFPCVARCTLGGELLGPPNYHGYQAAVQELRTSKYPKFNEQAFKSKIEMVKEQEVIDEWKQSQSRQYQYRLKSGPEDAALMSRKDAELLIRRELLGNQVQRTRKAIMPGALLNTLSDERLTRSIQDAYERDKGNPFSMLLALRPALKHMHLNMFRTDKENQFITAIPPTPLKGEAVQEIDHTLNFLEANPGCNRQALLQELCPGKAEDSPEAVHHLSSLRWLVDRGHVIEFYDGALAIPR